MGDRYLFVWRLSASIHRGNSGHLFHENVKTFHHPWPCPRTFFFSFRLHEHEHEHGVVIGLPRPFAEAWLNFWSTQIDKIKKRFFYYGFWCWLCLYLTKTNMQMFVIYAYKIHVCVTFEKLKKKMFNILRQSGFFLHFFIVLCFKTKTFFPYFKTKTPWILLRGFYPPPRSLRLIYLSPTSWHAVNPMLWAILPVSCVSVRVSFLRLFHASGRHDNLRGDGCETTRSCTCTAHIDSTNSTVVHIL